MTSRKRPRRFRWILGIASSGVFATGLLALGGGGPAGAAVAPGLGSSYAQSLQVTPHDGALAVGAVLGEALAGHTNSLARAQSQGLDLGAIGTSLTSYNCDQAPNQNLANLVPQPLETESGSPGAAAGQTATNPQQTDGSTEHVQATAAPYGEADTSFSSIAQGPFTVAGMAAKAWSGLVGGQREAGATSDVGSLTLAGGAVVLKGMHWEAVYPSGGAAKPSGSFSLGQAVVAGQVLPAGATTDLATVQAALNKVLGRVGMELVLPTASLASGVETVSPLQIEVVSNATRDDAVNGVLNATSPVVNPVASGLENGFSPSEPQQLEQELCQSDTAVTVADITLASIDGGGFFNLAFGGVNASSSDPLVNPYNLSLPPLGSLSGTSQFVPGAPAVAAVPGAPAIAAGAPAGPSGDTGSAPSATPAGAVPSTPPSVAPPPSTAAASAPAQTSPIQAVTSTAGGGPLLAIGLGGLGLLALLAEGDRRMMRRAQHRVTFEE